MHGRLYTLEDMAQAVAKWGGVTRRIITTTISSIFFSVFKNNLNLKIVKLYVFLVYVYVYFILCMQVFCI
jgi:hypothetical protein